MTVRSKAELFEAHRAAMAEILMLDHLPTAWNGSVTGYLVMASAAADLFVRFPLDDTYDEAAPVFTPQPVTPSPFTPSPVAASGDVA